MNGSTKPYKLEFYPEITKFVIKKFSEGYGYWRLSKLVEEVYGVRISHMSIKRYLDATCRRVSENIKSNPEKVEEARKLFLDTVEQMRAANKELWNLIKRLKAEGKDIEIIAALRELRKQVELQNRLLGKLQIGTQINVQNTNINTIQLAMQINKYLTKMEEKGWIIVKQHLKHKDAIERFEELVRERKKYCEENLEE